ncbi:DNA polymerase IV [Gordonia spumicola]|uniref:DNA polymerase IV n=2 Tax=Gordonia spumicola TaxID=589161 RepID=A0A7I9VDN2_9ACTN|nr:DNA polymerase IV [Gordonia spumicola]
MFHIDMDAFFASVEQLTRPTLAGRPVLVGGAGGRGVVAGASYEARVYGARSAMPMHQARRLVGSSAVVLPPRIDVYRVVSARVFGVVREFAPVIETLSFDEAFGEPTELAGASVDDAAAFAQEMRTAIREQTGLPASVGFGTGKQIAKIASGLAKPDGLRVIEPSRQLAFLQELPVRKLWGIGPVSGDRLARLGVETIGDLAAMSDTEVASVLGQTVGPSLHQLAKGIDHRPVAERASAKQISAESTFATDIVDLVGLRAAVLAAASDAHRRLLDDGRGARTVVVKLRRSDMSVLTRSSTLTAATTDLDVLTTAALKVMLDPLEIGPIRLVGVGYAGLSDIRQDSLFPELDADPGATQAPSDVPRGVQIPRGPRDDDDLPTGTDVSHVDHGHGWVQGGGHGFVTVRFETRTSGPGRTRTFRMPEAGLTRADPLASLDWDQAGDDAEKKSATP